MGIDRSKVLHSAQLFASKGQFDAAINEWKKLSAESPVAQALLGKRPGEIAVVSTPRGERRLRVERLG